MSHIERDARVLRQIRRLARTHEVSVVGYGPGEGVRALGVRMFSVSDPANRALGKARIALDLAAGRLGLSASFEDWYWSRPKYRDAYGAVAMLEPELIVANDWTALPIAFRLADTCGAEVVADMHEFAPEQAAHRPSFRVFIRPAIDYFLRRYASRIRYGMTVNETIADRYRTDYGLELVPVMNVPESPRPPSSRPVDPGHLRLVHHGVCAPDRKLELLLRVVSLLDSRFSLTFHLTNLDSSCGRSLTALAELLTPGRVFFRPAVPPDELVATLSAYDLGIHLLPPLNFNHAAALPNKFFDFVHAGLGVCIGPSSEMTRLCDKYGFGVVAGSFEPDAIAACINQLSAAEIDMLRNRAVAACAVLNSENEMRKLDGVVASAKARKREKATGSARHQGGSEGDQGPH